MKIKEEHFFDDSKFDYLNNQLNKILKVNTVYF